MYLIKITPKAYQDLLELKSYIEDDLCNPIAAQHCLKSIYKKIELLMEFPQIGKRLEGMNDSLDYLYVLCCRYLIFYRISDDEIYITRVLHESRNYMALMKRYI